MAVNLLDLAKSYLSTTVVDNLSSHLGESATSTQKTLDGALPTILAGLIQRSQEPGGASSIMDMVGQVMTPNRAAGQVITEEGDGLLGQLGNLISGGSDKLSALLSVGSSIISSLFGDKAGSIAGSLASYAGVKESSASTLLQVAGPALLSALGSRLSKDAGGASSITNLLADQREHVGSSIPSGLLASLGAIPGLGMLRDWISGPKVDVPPVRETVVRETVVQENVPPVRPVTPVREEPVYVEEKKTNWLPWLLLLAGILAALFFLMRGCNRTDMQAGADSLRTDVNNTANDVSVATDSATDRVGDAMANLSDEMKKATAKLGNFFKRKLPSGFELNIPQMGIENNLLTYIEDKSKPVDKNLWFNFDRLLFETGSDRLTAESQEQVKNMAEIMKAYPAVDIKIGGYTDNTGSAAVNKKLSTDRAVAVMNALVAQGVAKTRMEAEGYGPEHPVASNDTEEGRAQNRRIAVSVRKK